MTVAQERLNQWLRDAHAMELQAQQMMEGMARRIERYPELKARLDQHIDETRRQAESVKQCLDRRENGTSGMKNLAGRAMGLAQAISGAFAGDEIVKGSMAGYTFEHMEIAAYKILIATAEEAGDPETKRVCEGILHEEEAMAEWLENNLDGIALRFLELEQSGDQARH